MEADSVLVLVFESTCIIFSYIREQPARARDLAPVILKFILVSITTFKTSRKTYPPFRENFAAKRITNVHRFSGVASLAARYTSIGVREKIFKYRRVGWRSHFCVEQPYSSARKSNGNFSSRLIILGRR